MKKNFVKRTLIHAPAKVVFDWHKEERAFLTLIPPWEKIELLFYSGGIEEEGSEISFRLHIWGPFWSTWTARHQNFQEGVQFQDVQIKGPFASWLHTHRVVPEGPESCYLEDHIEYKLPFGFLGAWFGNWLVRRKLERTFIYRHQVTKEAIGIND